MAGWNCEVRKEVYFLILEYIKQMVWRALEEGLNIMIGGDRNSHIWEVGYQNGRMTKESMNKLGYRS